MGGGIGMGNTCKPMAVLFQCMTKFTTNKKKKKELPLYYFSTLFTKEIREKYAQERKKVSVFESLKCYLAETECNTR